MCRENILPKCFENVIFLKIYSKLAKFYPNLNSKKTSPLLITCIQLTSLESTKSTHFYVKLTF